MMIASDAEDEVIAAANSLGYPRRSIAGISIEPSADVRKRLAERLARLEASIEAIFDQPCKDDLSAGEYRSLYRMLGGYRGLSEAAIDSAQLAENVNWAPWHETRF